MTPHQYYITQGRNMERPYTGHIWYEERVGDYHCSVCENKLFTFDHKYDNKNGMGTFWNHVQKSLEIIEENDQNKVELDVENQVIPEEGDQPKKQL